MYCTHLLSGLRNMKAALLFSLLAGTIAIHSELHPEYQSGLSINGVPAHRREFWMRVANEVSSKFALIC